jgi:hypothetical protein
MSGDGGSLVRGFTAKYGTAFKRIMGYHQFWMLEARLKGLTQTETVDATSRVA